MAIALTFQDSIKWIGLDQKFIASVTCLELRYEGNGTLIVAHVPPELAQKLDRYTTQS